MLRVVVGCVLLFVLVVLSLCFEIYVVNINWVIVSWIGFSEG